MNKFKEEYKSLIKGSKKYITRLDMSLPKSLQSKHGEYWFTGQAKSFTDSEIQQIKDTAGSRAALIEEHDSSPRRMVNLDGKEMSWGDYLRLRNQSRNK